MIDSQAVFRVDEKQENNHDWNEALEATEINSNPVIAYMFDNDCDDYNVKKKRNLATC